MRRLSYRSSSFFAVMLLCGCGGLPVPSSDALATRPAPSSPIPAGVYRGQMQCEMITDTPQGRFRDVLMSPGILEFNKRGVLIVEGQEIAVGRTVTVGEFRGTYTRITPTATGVIVDADLESGFSIAEVSARADGVDYSIQVLQAQDSSTTTTSCNGFLQ